MTIVDFCKVVINPEPADLALEMRAVKFMLDYDGAKEVEYERLRRAESRVEKNLRRSTLGRKAKGKKFADRVEPDELPSQDEIDVSVFHCSQAPFAYPTTLVPSVQPPMPHEVGL